MSLGFWTWAAIAVLVAGSLAIFVWFVFDAVEWVRRHPAGKGKGE